VPLSAPVTPVSARVTPVSPPITPVSATITPASFERLQSLRVAQVAAFRHSAKPSVDPVQSKAARMHGPRAPHWSSFAHAAVHGFESNVDEALEQPELIINASAHARAPRARREAAAPRELSPG
jgi:hypothetical protein